MRIHLKDIKVASQCSRRYQFSRSLPDVIDSRNLTIVKQVLHKAYTRMLEFGYRADWRTILNWVDTRVFQDIDVSDEEQFEKSKSQSEIILNFISSWYKKMYLPENISVYTEVPVTINIGSYQIYDSLPIVKVGEVPTILYVTDIATSLTGLYNDIQVRGQQLMLSQSLDCNNISAELLTLGDKGGYNLTKIYAGQKEHKRVENVIHQVATIIGGNANYPSYSDACMGCPFKSKCKL